MKLLDCIREEESVWELCYQHSEILGGRARAYWYPPYSEHPHWNVVYPREESQRYSATDLAEIERFYTQKGCKSHVLDTTGEGQKWTVSEDDYFYQETTRAAPPSVEVTISTTEDLSLFSKIVQRSFGFNEAMLSIFASKMKLLQQTIPSKFYVVSFDGEVAGCWSSFTTVGGFEFLMNGAVLPEFRNRGVATAMGWAMAETSNGRGLTHTNNDQFRNRILPMWGFRSAGKVLIVPVKEWRQT